MATVRKVLFDKFDGEFVAESFIFNYEQNNLQLLEVVRCVRNLPWFISEPFYHILDGGEKLLFLFLGICVIIAQVTNTVVNSGVAKVEVDSFSVTNVKDSVWLWWKPSSNLTARNFQMVFHVRHRIIGSNITKI